MINLFHMNKKTFYRTILVIFAVWLWNGGIDSYAQTQDDKSLSIKSEVSYLENNRQIARGNVEISWEEYRIYADYIEYDPNTKDVVAQGRVTMCSNDTVLSGERLNFNLKTRSGVIYDTYGQVPPTVRYKTDKLSQVDNETLKFNKIDFTTCSQCVPRWKITCSKGKIKKEKYIEMSNIVLKIKKVPIFYLPYMRYPLNPDGKATGFLFPRLGRSDLRGFFIMNSFFWDIKPNLDLTLGVDYFSKAGIGTSQELRYLFNNVSGNIKFYYFKYKNGVILPKGTTPTSNTFYTYNNSDYYLTADHKQSLSFLNTKIIAKVDKQSDANFLRLFSSNFDSILRRTSGSSISISSSLKNMKFSASASQNDTYYTFSNESRTLRYLPVVTFNLNQQKIWKLPGYLSLDLSYASIKRQGKSYEADDVIYTTDIQTNRLNINPSYRLRLIDVPWLNTLLSFSAKNSFYPKSIDPETDEIVNKPLHLSYQTVVLDFKGPVFSKIFEFKNSKLKHLINPGITIQYVTKVNPEKRAQLIPVDNFDNPDYSYVGFYFTTRLLGKTSTQKSPTELLSYTISQDYYFDPKEANRNRQVNGVYPSFSELRNTLRLRLFKYFSVDATVNFNHYATTAPTFLDRFSRLNLSIAYTNKKSPIYGSFNYSRYINMYNTEKDYFNRDTIGGSLNVDVPGFPLKLDSKVYYDLTDKVFRNASFKISFDYQCIYFNTELKLYKYQNRIETQFDIGITLGNLGMVKDFLGLD